MKKLLILSALFISCSFSNPSNYLADTWAGNASNQLFTYKALIDGIVSGNTVVVASTTPPDTREIYTKADLSAYPLNVIWYDGFWDISNTFSSFGTGQAITRTDVERSLALLETNSSGVPTPAFVTTVYYLPKGRLLTTIAVGDQLFTNRQSTINYSAASVKYYWFAFGPKILTVSTAGIITAITSI